MPTESEDEHLPFGERSHRQRLITYACIALGAVLISGLIFTGILTFEEGGLYKPAAYVGPPLCAIYFAYRFVKELLSES